MFKQLTRRSIVLTLAVLLLTVIVLPPVAAAADNTPRELYYSRVLKEFLAQGKKNTVVMLRDIDNDGEDELVTYWQEELKAPYWGYESEIRYRMDVYDMQDSRELHFSQEKSEYYGFEHNEVIFITAKGYLAFYAHYSDISQQPGWVYDHSTKHSISGGLYTAGWMEEATFDGVAITQDEFREKREQYGLTELRYDGDEFLIVSYNYGTSIFPYANTQNDISRLSNIVAPSATPTKTTFMLNGAEVALPAYIINDNNYVKLRDLAALLETRFDVRWEDGKAKLYNHAGYSVIGGELVPVSTESKTAQLSNTDFVWGESGEAVIGLRAYNIGGNNYIKLRDIAQLFDFDVDWRDGKAWIEPDVSPYTPD